MTAFRELPVPFYRFLTRVGSLECVRPRRGDGVQVLGLLYIFATQMSAG